MAHPSDEPRKHSGSCHCGNNRFEVEIDATHGAMCNCSICQKSSLLAGFAKPAAFRLLTPESNLSVYEWGPKISKRYFCKTCGVYCFARGHLEELGGDYVSISLNALDDIDPGEVSVAYWDGRHDNWHAGTRDRPWPIFRD
jgi:hypothetical protein